MSPQRSIEEAEAKGGHDEHILEGCSGERGQERGREADKVEGCVSFTEWQLEGALGIIEESLVNLPPLFKPQFSYPNNGDNTYRVEGRND